MELCVCVCDDDDAVNVRLAAVQPVKGSSARCPKAAVYCAQRLGGDTAVILIRLSFSTVPYRTVMFSFRSLLCLPERWLLWA